MVDLRKETQPSSYFNRKGLFIFILGFLKLYEREKLKSEGTLQNDKSGTLDVLEIAW